MKKFLIFISVPLLLAACAGADKKEENKTPVVSNVDASGLRPGELVPAGTTDTSNYTTIEWIDNTNQTLPNVKEGEKVLITYRFRNTGSKPLVVENVEAGCGCTVPERPEEPILPGQTGVIKASFNSSGRTGPNTKHITVKANTNSEKNLSFSIEVIK